MPKPPLSSWLAALDLLGTLPAELLTPADRLRFRRRMIGARSEAARRRILHEWIDLCSDRMERATLRATPPAVKN